MGRSEKRAWSRTSKPRVLTFEQDNAKRMAEYIKGDLEKNLQGLTIQIKQQPFKQKLQLEQTGDYDITMANWGPDYKDPISYLELFTTGNQNNKMNYSNRHYDELIKKAKSDLVLDQKKRWEALQEAERILLGMLRSHRFIKWAQLTYKRIM